MSLKPPILRPGDTIGIVTLGSPLDPNIINARINTLINIGFEVIIGESVYLQNGFLAGTDEQRATDLMNMFQNKNIDMILPTRGGVGLAGILPYLDFEIIKNNPKIITGYSDLTVLLNVLTQHADLITFHGLLLIDFQPKTPSFNYDHFFAALSTVISPRQIMNPLSIPLVSILPGNVTGQIVGGNLTSFVDTLGTPFDIDTNGKIIFIEDTNEPINRMYRYMNHLKLAGKFDDCLGIIIGQCTGCQISYGKTFDDLINDFFVPLGKPLMTNLATGHGLFKVTIPIGGVVNLDTTNNTLTIIEPSVSAKK